MALSRQELLELGQNPQFREELFNRFFGERVLQHYLQLLRRDTNGTLGTNTTQQHTAQIVVVMPPVLGNRLPNGNLVVNFSETGMEFILRPALLDPNPPDPTKKADYLAGIVNGQELEIPADFLAPGRWSISALWQRHESDPLEFDV